MATIGIVGYGFVGEAVAKGFENEYSILFFDKYKISTSLDVVGRRSDFIFICLPTPSSPDGIDLSIMDEVMRELTKLTDETEKIIIIKSTVIPGTTARYSKLYPRSRFAFSPEFLREKNHIHDFQHPDRIVIGADRDDILRTCSTLFQKRFPDSPLFTSDTIAAEMCKYMANAFLATKIIFANEVFDLCEKIGANYDLVKKMAGADARIGEAHFTVTPERGFGGKCFPKDIIAFIKLFQKRGVDAELLETVWRKNMKVRKNHDWKSIPFALTKVERHNPTA